MSQCLWRAPVVAFSLIAMAGVAFAQEMGPLQSFGSEGRLFSAGTLDYFLMTRQSYATEDSTGYQGLVRAVRKYAGGAFEIKMRDYTARCVAPFDNLVYVTWSEAGQEKSLASVNITNPAKFPGVARKESYNLYWAVCHGQFRKFK